MQIMYLTNIPIVSVMEHAVIEKANPIALSEDQKAALNKYKIQARKDNEIFLRQHPDLRPLECDQNKSYLKSHFQGWELHI